MNLFRTKSVNGAQESSGLMRNLTAFDLTMLGIGVIIGAGIFVLTGIAAATMAGPAIILSYLLAGVACACAALSYAELSTSVGGSGSAYGYAYAGFGELIAWLIGWDLLLEYGIAVSAVSIGWSSYLGNALSVIGLTIPEFLLKNPFEEGGLINLPALLIVLFITGLLVAGIKTSKRFNLVIVFIKLLTVAVFIGVAVFKIDLANWQPFAPFGWEGVISGAALVFFSYIGFDALSTAAEETIEPQKNLPRGILGSLIVCTVLYMVVAGLLTLITPYINLNTTSPVSFALLNLGYDFAGGLVAAGAIAGLTTGILVMFYGFTRIFLAMSRDGLLPSALSKVNAKTHSPVRIIVGSGVVISLISGFAPMGALAELINIGTLTAFIIVCAGVITLRYTKPDLHRPFKVMLSPYVPLVGILLCSYFIISLPSATWLRFACWMGIGCVVYFCYGYFNSHLAKET